MTQTVLGFSETRDLFQDVKSDHNSTRRLSVCIVSSLFLLAIAGAQLQAASAVATGIDSRGSVAWGWASGDDLQDAKFRAMQFCKASGAARPKIVLFTPSRGYGAIVIYKEAGNAVNIAASIGDATEKQAIANALKKAKSAGGYTPKLWRTWHDFALGENNF
jgi:hypothetical protein